MTTARPAGLLKYDAARTALAAAARVDEAKSIRDKAVAMAAYARQAQDRELLAWATEIKVRAERRAGELLRALKGSGQRQGVGPPRKQSSNDKMIIPRLADLGISLQQSSDWGRLAALPEAVYEARLAAAAQSAQVVTTAAMLKGPVRGTAGTGDNEWYTPLDYIAAARDVLGGIDLDPATTAKANKAIGARHFYTREDDGLAHPWPGQIWLNPPYAQPAIGRFIDKLVAEVTAGRTTAAIVLIHNYTDTAWFRAVAGVATVLCFTSGRVRFVDAAGGLASPTQGQVFCHIGPHAARFAHRFKAVGVLLTRFRDGG